MHACSHQAGSRQTPVLDDSLALTCQPAHTSCRARADVQHTRVSKCVFWRVVGKKLSEGPLVLRIEKRSQLHALGLWTLDTSHVVSPFKVRTCKVPTGSQVTRYYIFNRVQAPPNRVDYPAHPAHPALEHTPGCKGHVMFSGG